MWLRSLVDEDDAYRCIGGINKCITLNSCGTRARTKRGEVYQGLEGDGPAVHGINDVATIKLGGQAALDT